MTTGRLAHKVARVTGAGSGFGRAIAKRFSEEGCIVVAADLNHDGARETFSQLRGPGRSIPLRMDVTKESDWKMAVQEATRSLGGLDVLVNNAGWSYKNKPTLAVTEQDLDRLFDVNVKSIYYCMPAVVPIMKQAGGGSIINIASIGAFRPRPGLVWYNATKAAVVNATKGLAAENGPDQIRVNALYPLLSGTGLFEAFSGVPYSEDNLDQFTAQVPLGRLTEPVDVANAALFFASDEGKFLTGQGLIIDGGKGI